MQIANKKSLYDLICAFRVSLEEKTLLKEQAKKLGISLSQYIRDCVFSTEVTLKKTKMIIDNSFDYIYQLSRIGNNLNQLTYYVNKKQKTGDLSAELDRALLEELLQVLREILDKITINQ